ncbi:MAG: hypothetical protein H7A52_14905 [Akkermansiaceae bacterium]|nr:hypothetical protein [Akkermansiaceae bacterium]
MIFRLRQIPLVLAVLPWLALGGRGAVCRLADAFHPSSHHHHHEHPAESFHEVDATPCFGHETGGAPCHDNAPLPCGQDLDRDAFVSGAAGGLFPPKLPDFPSEWNSMNSNRNRIEATLHQASRDAIRRPSEGGRSSPLPSSPPLPTICRFTI